jgi:hypothetical protein
LEGLTIFQNQNFKESRNARMVIPPAGLSTWALAPVEDSNDLNMERWGFIGVTGAQATTTCLNVIITWVIEFVPADLLLNTVPLEPPPLGPATGAEL